MKTRTRVALALLGISLLVAGCSKPQEKEARYIKRGNELFEEGKFKKARVEYKNAARILPGDAEVAYRIGLVDEAEGNLRGAFVNFARAEQQDSHYLPPQLKLGEYYLAGEQYDEVQKRLDAMLADAPEDAGAHALHAALLLRQNDYDGTEKEARYALAKDPSSIIAFSVLTGLYTAQENSEKALTTVNEGIARNPKSLPLVLLKTEIYARNGDLPKMAESYQAVFKLAPGESEYRDDLAMAYLKAGQLDNAETTLREGVASLPNDEEMKHQLISFLADHRGADAAEKEIRGYMKDNPDNSDLNTWLVELYVSHGAVDRAVAFLNDIIARNGFDKQALSARAALARIDYINGDKDAAAQLANTVLEKDQNNLDALFIKARIEADRGAYQNAIVDLRTIIRAQPKSKEALRLLAETLMRQGHLDLAIDTLNQQVDFDPLDFDTKVRLAQMYHLNGNSKHAMDLLFFVTKAQPKYPVGWESTARVAIAIKDWQTAETAIRTLDGLEDQHLTAVFLRGLLLDRMSKPEEALAQYRQVIDADPSSALAEHAITGLVGDYKTVGRMDEATRYVESLKLNSATVHTILGESYLAAGKTEQAANDFDMAITGNAQHPEPYLERARMFVYEHKPNDAIETLKKGAGAAPGDIRMPMMQAEILGQQGRYQEAIALYDDLLAHNPDLDGVANNLAETIADYQYTDPGALEKAQHVAERFTGSSNPLLLDTLAWVYYRQGDVGEAQTIMQRALSLGGTLPPQVHYHYGAILLKTDKTSEAKAELQKATIQGASYPGVDDARKMLTGL